MDTLYYAPRTRASRVRWALEEIGAPYTLHLFDGDEHLSDAYRAIHPLCKVPAWTDENGTLIESVAICMYLADKHPEAGLAPAAGAGRGRYYQWTAFVAGTMEPAMVDFMVARRDHGDDSDQAAAALTHLHTVMGVLDTALAAAPYLAAQTFTVADLLCGGVSLWVRSAVDLSAHVHVVDWLGRLRGRPAFVRAMAD